MAAPNSGSRAGRRNFAEINHRRGGPTNRCGSGNYNLSNLSVGAKTAQAAELLTSASASVTSHAKTIHEQVRAFTEEIRRTQTQCELVQTDRVRRASVGKSEMVDFAVDDER